MKIIAVIPARGGSKGIPLKNIKLIGGKPLIAYSIEAAKKSRLINKIYVSTDHSGIAEIAEGYGASVIKRPSEISGDAASSESAVLHALDHIKKNECYEADICVLLQCTSPLTAIEDIDGTIENLISNNSDSALSVTPFHYFLWRIDDKQNAVGINHDMRIRALRQNRTNQYLETGAIYAFRVKGFIKAKHRFFGKTTAYIMPPERCLEIDDPIDISIAQAIILENKKANQLQFLPKKIDAIVFDFDGVFTDNKVMVDENGKESVFCNRSDGLGLAKLKALNIPMLVLSSEKNQVVNERCKKLGIRCIHGREGKIGSLLKWIKTNKFKLENTIYLGNDINDTECLMQVGCAVVVKDAHDDVNRLADIILQKTGGNGAIRELIDLIQIRIEENK